METRTQRPQIAQGKVRLQVDGLWFDEGVHFAMDRVNGKVFLIIDSALGKKGSVLNLKEQVDYTKPVVKKKRKKAQWKTRG